MSFPDSSPQLIRFKSIDNGNSLIIHNDDGHKQEQKKHSFNLSGLKTTFSSRTNDDVHRSIPLCPLMRCVLDTPHMQRLRGLKQLGVSEMTYVPTTHCRFEHSLGVASLAQQVLLEIAKKQPNLGITEKDIVCVKLAGLLHDIGHGPFSHVYDGNFRKQLKRAEQEGSWLGVKFDKNIYDGMPPCMDGWEHEDGSLMMIDALLASLGLKIDEENLDSPLKQIGDGVNANCFGIYECALHQNREGMHYDGTTELPSELVLTSRDWIFIKECIVGCPLPSKGMSVDQTKKSNLRREWVGRPNLHKEWLYDIVSNRHSGLDVDKIDYLARDERRAYGTSGPVDPLLIENAHVAWSRCPYPSKCFRCKHHVNQKHNADPDSKEDFHLMICYPDKMVQNIMNFFKKRFSNHNNLYTHKNTSAACYMVCDILLLAEPFIRLPTTHEGDGTSKYYPGEDEHSKVPPLTISRAIVDPNAYLLLKDSILDIIAASDRPELKQARLLLNRYRAHKIYKKIASQAIMSSDGKQIDYAWQRELWEMDELEMAAQIIKCSQLHNSPPSLILKLDDIIIEKRVIHHGMKADNPVNGMRFVPKHLLSKLRETPDKLPIAIQVDEKAYECSIPRAFLQRTLRIYCRNPSCEINELLETCYHQFIEITKKQYGDSMNVYAEEGFDEDDEGEAFAPPAMLSQSPRAFNESAMSHSNLSGIGDVNGEPDPKRIRRSLFEALNGPHSP